ncbi:hypothetical protein, partial [Pantoea sp. B_10]|uniref:hypothetical protein n=1 Tax=Pantoea sp. B_10 TaxID=2608006 RepID=UPI001CC1EC1C
FKYPLFAIIKKQVKKGQNRSACYIPFVTTGDIGMRTCIHIPEITTLKKEFSLMQWTLHI